MPEGIPSQPGAGTPPGTDFNIGDEFGTARKNLPPLKIVLICVAVIAVIALIVSFVQRPHSATIGTIDDVVSTEVPDQDSVMVAINVSVQNQGVKPYWIRTIRADVETANGNFSDDAASPVD